MGARRYGIIVSLWVFNAISNECRQRTNEISNWPFLYYRTHYLSGRTRSSRTTEDSSSRRIMRLVPIFTLKTINQTNNECLPKFVQTHNASSSIKTAIEYKKEISYHQVTMYYFVYYINTIETHQLCQTERAAFEQTDHPSKTWSLWPEAVTHTIYLRTDLSGRSVPANVKCP